MARIIDKQVNNKVVGHLETDETGLIDGRVMATGHSISIAVGNEFVATWDITKKFDRAWVVSYLKDYGIKPATQNLHSFPWLQEHFGIPV